MRRSTWLVAMGAALAVVAGESAFAQATQNSQQAKMTSCNADAKVKGLTGDERKSFMKTCLSDSGAAPAAQGNSQQEKMKSCNADAKAKGLTGADRKAFMKTCLSGS
jgi:psiF repeat-containing protein